MPRSARLEYPGACYHVINRGNYRRNIFESDGAREAFERTLFQACERFAWRLHAYVIMRNHFHLALETPDPNLSAGMKWLQATWVARFNRLRGIAGRPFQGRFKSLHVQPGQPLAEVCHYIHLNPVRARIVPVDDIGSFRWSSLRWFPLKSCPGYLDGFTVRSESGALPDSRSGWKCYVHYLAQRAAEPPADLERRILKLSHGWCWGDDAFRKEMRSRLNAMGEDDQRRRFMSLEPEHRQHEREVRWTQMLQAGAEALGVNLDELSPKKSAAEKVVLAAAMKAVTDVTNGWLARKLKMGEPASVSQFVRRFHLARGAEKPDFRRVRSCLST